MDKKIVYITGCFGFMGSHFALKALEKGWKVYGVDKCTYAADLSLFEIFSSYSNFSFEKKDIRKLNFLNDCDFIINFAAESHVENSIVDSEQFINSNILGVKNLLELIRLKHQNVGDRPVLLQISTDEVYGDISKGEHHETDILRPSNPYSSSKASADMLINAWSRTYGVKYIIMRPTNNYGPNQYPEKLIPLSVKNLLRGKKIRLHNSGTPVRNWLHVDDTSEAIFSVIGASDDKKQNSVLNTIFNIAGGFEQTNADTVKKVVQAFYENNKNKDWKQYVDFSYNRAGQDVRYALNDDRLQSIGWKAKKNFDKEIYSIVQHCKEKFSW